MSGLDGRLPTNEDLHQLAARVARSPSRTILVELELETGDYVEVEDWPVVYVGDGWDWDWPEIPVRLQALLVEELESAAAFERAERATSRAESGYAQ